MSRSGSSLFSFDQQTQTCIVSTSNKNITIVEHCKAENKAWVCNKQIWLSSCTSRITKYTSKQCLQTLTHRDKRICIELIFFFTFWSIKQSECVCSKYDKDVLHGCDLYFGSYSVNLNGRREEDSIWENKWRWWQCKWLVKESFLCDGRGAL